MKPQFSQPKGSVSKETNKDSIARKFGCKKSEVLYAKPGSTLTGYKVIYDKVTQRSYALPSNLPAVATITSLTDGILVHNTGTVDLGQLAVTRREWVKLQETFTTGVTLRVANEVISDGSDLYRWNGSFPKVVAPDTHPFELGWVKLYPSKYYKTSHTFVTGGQISSNDAVLNTADGMYYINTVGPFPLTVAPNTVPDSSWLCVGLLDVHPLNSVLNFGVSGIGNETDKLRKFHTYCNYAKITASYQGVSQVTVNSTADISVQTSVDWAGIKFIFNKDQTLADWVFIPVFRVSDPTTPLETVPETWESGTLFAGRSTLRNTSYSFEEGVICFDTNIDFGKRYTTDSVFYKLRQVFKVFKGGVLEYPTDISIAGGSLGTVQFRKQPTSTLLLRGVTLDTAGSNQLQFIAIERNKVHLDDVQIINTGSQDNIRTVIYGYKVCDLTLTNIRGTGNETLTSGAGSYLIGGDFIANLLMEHIGVDAGLPNIGFNVINGVRVKDSHINRFDGHSFLHNAFIKGNSFGSYGIFYGIGGGILEVTDNVISKGYIPGRGSFVDLGLYSFITARSDYGGVWYGHQYIKNNIMKLDTRVDLSAGSSAYPYKFNVISYDSSGNYGFTDKKPIAYSVTLKDNMCMSPSVSYFFDFAGMTFGAGLSTGNLFPERIVIENLGYIGECQGNHQILPIIFPTTYANFTCNGAATLPAGNCNIRIRGVRGAITRARSADRSMVGWTPAIAEQTDANRVTPYVQIDSCTGLALRWSINGSTVLVSNSELRDFSTASSGTPTHNITFSNCTFYFIDGSQSQLANSRVYNSRVLRQSAGTGNVQFGGILSVQGVTLASGITLANGGNSSITVDTIFTGYKS